MHGANPYDEARDMRRGAGTAGLEGLLATHAQFGSSADLRVIAPEREFRYGP